MVSGIDFSLFTFSPIFPLVFYSLLLSLFPLQLHVSFIPTSSFPLCEHRSFFLFLSLLGIFPHLSGGIKLFWTSTSGEMPSVLVCSILVIDKCSMAYSHICSAKFPRKLNKSLQFCLTTQSRSSEKQAIVTIEKRQTAWWGAVLIDMLYGKLCSRQLLHCLD